MDIADKVSIKSTSRVGQTDVPNVVLSVQEKSRLPSAATEDGFEIMANVIWAEIGQAIMDELGGVVFSAGRPDEFRKVSA